MHIYTDVCYQSTINYFIIIIDLEFQSQPEQELEKQLSELRRSKILDFSNNFINAYTVDLATEQKKSFAKSEEIETLRKLNKVLTSARENVNSPIQSVLG